MSYIVYAYVSVLFVITRNDSYPRFSGVTFIALLHGLEQETIGNNKKIVMVGAGFTHQVRISNIPAVSETACSP